ncbi:MAG: PAS domain S-box protein [Myxococcaceae bacterium]|nr:PAS domain S-box protein [Myxococcaceae bacterium]
MSDDAVWTEELFRALTLHSVDIISLLDGQGRLLFNSPATVRINGFTPEELQHKDTFELIHPEDRAEVARVFAEVLGAPGTLRTVEYRYLTKDGRWLWMEAVASNQLDNPAVRGVVANSRDISERKRAEAERQKTELRLRELQKLESLGRMAGGVAHDFNNLLTVILGEASALRGEVSGARGLESIEAIEAAVGRASELTHRLLAYLGLGRTALADTDLHELVTGITPLLEGAAHGRAQLAFELASGVARVRCDPAQVREVLLSLVNNACEAIEGAGTVVVRLSQRSVDPATFMGPSVGVLAAGPAVVLEVADTGVGMTADVVARIYDPFFSTKQVGRGLGLAAVAGIVRSHGAGLGLTTAPGKGTTFSVCFPLTR